MRQEMNQFVAEGDSMGQYKRVKTPLTICNTLEEIVHLIVKNYNYMGSLKDGNYT
jgi:hypothetical protein